MNGEYFPKGFRPHTNYLPNSFVLKFKKGQSYIMLANQLLMYLTLQQTLHWVASHLTCLTRGM